VTRLGLSLAFGTLFVLALLLTGCPRACHVLDLAHEACVIIQTVDANGAKVEIKVPGSTAMKYLETGRIGVERCK
jgi:hypothetical protein